MSALALVSCAAPAARLLRSDPRSAVEEATSTNACALDPDEPRLCAVLAIDGDDDLVVVLHLEPAALPAGRRNVSLDFSFPTDLAGERSSLDLGAVREPRQIRYRVAWSASSEDSLAFRRPGGWHLSGSAFLPTLRVDGETAPVPVRLRVDAGASPVWSSAGSGPHFDAPSFERLADESYEIGELKVVERQVAGVVLRVGTSGEEAGLDELADALSRALASLARQLGSPAPRSFLVTFHPSDRPEIVAAQRGAAFVERSARGVPPDPLYGIEAAVRALSRTFFPDRSANDDELDVFGVAEYFAVLAMNELTGASSEWTARFILRAHERYTRELTPDALPRAASLPIAYCVDGHLRRRGSSFGAALRTTLSRSEETLRVDSLLEDLAAVSPQSAGYLAALLGGEGPFALDECLAREGFETREIAFEGVSDEGLRTLFGSSTPLALTPAFEIREPPASGLLERGDVVVEVEGVRASTPNELAWALHERSSLDRIRLVVRRRGEERALELPPPDAPLTSRTHVLLLEASEPP